MQDTQILSLISLLDTEQRAGKLAQLATGEGKSTVVSMLTVIKGLQGEKIDIVTIHKK